jgi:hypothetical protein
VPPLLPTWVSESIWLPIFRSSAFAAVWLWRSENRRIQSTQCRVSCGSAGTVGAGGSSLDRWGSAISSQFQSLPALRGGKAARDRCWINWVCQCFDTFSAFSGGPFLPLACYAAVLLPTRVCTSCKHPGSALSGPAPSPPAAEPSFPICFRCTSRRLYLGQGKRLPFSRGAVSYARPRSAGIARTDAPQLVPPGHLLFSRDLWAPSRQSFFHFFFSKACATLSCFSATCRISFVSFS